MKSLVTGAAGFIGSRLAERLLKEGHEVVGIDCFTDYYSRMQKEENVRTLRANPSFKLFEKNLLAGGLEEEILASDCIFHLAAQAGVRASWGRDFEVYTANNIVATQKLLEICKESTIKLFVYASSSSVYGDTPDLPFCENGQVRPVSPYGVSKLAGEHLCRLYRKNFGVPMVILRYFTVYGPGQRPDMAFHVFLKAMLKDREIAIFGNGEQTRDFTYIDDIVEGTLLATKGDCEGKTFNLGGGARTSLNEVLRLLETITGKKSQITYQKTQKGDPPHTFADITLAEKKLGYSPQTRLNEGLQREYEWLRSLAS
jgi:UDP-glucose 4-epimerase